MNNPTLLKQGIRAVLAMYPTRRLTDPMIVQLLSVRMPEPVEHTEYVEARNWNQGKGLIDYRPNDESNAQEWFLTPEGKQMEGI